MFNFIFVFFKLHFRLEFDIIGESDSTCNKSPVVYVDHHLGLEKWCVPHLYKYAYTKVIQFKLNNQRTGILFDSTKNNLMFILKIII